MGNVRRASATTGLLAAAVASLVLLPGGPRLTPDSVQYLEFARTGQGSVGLEFVWWPPLYPALIAAWPAALTVAVNVAAAAATAVAVTVGTSRVARDPAAPWLAGAAAALAWPIVMVSGFVWSDGLFTALAAWFVVAIADDRPAAAGWLAAAASTTRYTGVVCIVLGAVLVARWHGPRWRAWTAWSSVPLAAWLVRNLVVDGTLTGQRPPASVGLAENVARVAEVAAGWVVPGLAAAAVLWLWALAFARGRHGSAAALFALGYAAAVVAGASTADMDPINVRLLAPVLPALLICLASSASRLPTGHAGRVVVAGVAVLMAITTATHIGGMPARDAMAPDHVLRPQLAGCATSSWSCL